MSKQGEAKNAQGYEPNPRARACMNCLHYRAEFIEEKGVFGSWVREKDRHCALGGFVVKKTATCQKFELKPITAE